jgi:hypothetical protein
LGHGCRITKIENRDFTYQQVLAFQSGGRLSVNWQSPNSWIQMAKIHKTMVDEIIDLSDPLVDYSNVTEVSSISQIF